VTVPASARSINAVYGRVDGTLSGGAEAEVTVLTAVVDPRGGSLWAIASGLIACRRTSQALIAGTARARLYINGVLQQEVFTGYGATINAWAYERFALVGSLSALSGSIVVRLAIATIGATSGWEAYIQAGAALVGGGGRR
jgi:hypothetical protein